MQDDKSFLSEGLFDCQMGMMNGAIVIFNNPTQKMDTYRLTIIDLLVIIKIDPLHGLQLRYKEEILDESDPYSY